jgi:nicotinate-nucleotide pyrophosphorylase (carboxylating)
MSGWEEAAARAVRLALEEDLGDGDDVTTRATVPLDARGAGRIVARQAGVVAGLPLAQAVFREVDSEIVWEPNKIDGADVSLGEVMAVVSGPLAGMFTAERTALNFLGHLSGIATATRQMVEAVRGTRAQIVDTRKTTPGLRLLEKYAVRMGGGTNHRMGLYDAILIKDNHLVAAGGVRAAVERSRAIAPGLAIQVEVESLEQLEEALACGVESVLLDNMEPERLRLAVARVAGRAVTEASGGVSMATVREIAETGVDRISAGWLTHSAPNLDLALEIG